MAPPCCSFSSAVTPRVRSPRFPRGLPWLVGKRRAKVLEGNSHAEWCRRLIDLCEKAKVSWWLEQPDTSMMWRLREFRRFRAPDSQHVWRGDFCYFGTAWRKRTRVACSNETSRAPPLLPLSRPARCASGTQAGNQRVVDRCGSTLPQGVCAHAGRRRRARGWLELFTAAS